MIRRVSSSGFSPRAIRTTPPVTSLPSFSITPRRKPGASETRATSASRIVPPTGAASRTFSRSEMARRASNDSSPGFVEAPSQFTPRTTYSAFPLTTTWPAAAAFAAAIASPMPFKVTPKSLMRSGSGATSYSIGKPPTLETSATPGTDPS